MVLYEFLKYRTNKKKVADCFKSNNNNIPNRKSLGTQTSTEFNSSQSLKTRSVDHRSIPARGTRAVLAIITKRFIFRGRKLYLARLLFRQFSFG